MVADGLLLSRAKEVLRGAGDVDAGEWAEDPGRGVVHLRRRLTKREAHGLAVVDIRDTWEAQKRFNAVRRYLPAGWTEIA